MALVGIQPPKRSVPTSTAGAPASEKSSTARPPIPALTGLRFLAALWVVVDHYRWIFHYPPLLQAVAERGGAGVCLFFILSGFVLTYNYHDWFTGSVARFGIFLRARFARIAPMYLVALLLMTPVTILFPHAPMTEFGARTQGVIAVSWLANLTLIQGYLPYHVFHIWNAPGWSLSAEWSFYLIFPLFVRHVLAKFRRTGPLIGLIAGLYLIEAGLFLLVTFLLHRYFDHATFVHYTDYFTDFFPVMRVWEFFIGCAIGVLFLRSRPQALSVAQRFVRSRRGREALLALTLAACVACPVVLRLISGDGYAVFAFEWYVMYTPLFALLIAVLASGPALLGRFLESKPMLLLGEASFSLYIIHWIPFTLLSERVATNGNVSNVIPIVVILGTILASVTFFHYVEVPARRFLRSRPLPRLAAAGATRVTDVAGLG